MNTKTLLVLSLAGVVSAQAGLADNHLDRLSPKAREFVEKYKAEKANKKINAQKRKVVLKSDILGRKSKKGQFRDSTVYMVEDEIEPKMEVTVTDLKVDNIDIEPISAFYSFNGDSKEEKFWLNGKNIDRKSFFKKTEDWEKRRAKKRKPLKKSYRAFLTPTEIEKKLKSSDAIYIESDELQVEPNYLTVTDYTRGYGYYTANYVTRDEALEISQLNFAHADGYKGNDVGVYYLEQGCARVSEIPDPSKHSTPGCSGTSDHATGVTGVLQLFAPNVNVYGYDYTVLNSHDGPADPSSFSPKIYIGTTSLGFYYNGQYRNNYEVIDAQYDNYVYETSVTEFVNAGNLKSESLQPEPTIHSPGKAANVITVGAVNPLPSTTPEGPAYFYLPYSNYINSNIGNTKPDIMNLTNFTDPIFPDVYGDIFNGTSASTPYSAAMGAVLMSKHPFFKGHPEMVKPVFLTSTLGSLIEDRDSDGGAVPGVPAFNLMASNKSFSGYWNRANYTSLFKDANGNNKTQNVLIDGLVAGEKYKLAVTWLMKGNTIKSLGKLPIKMEAHLFQNGTEFTSKSSYEYSSASMQEIREPYILHSFTVPASGKIILKLACTQNDAPDDQMIMGFHMSRVP